MFRSATKTVRYIPLSGIDQKAIRNVKKSLASLNKKNCDALLIGLNSKGSVVDAEILGEMLKRKIKKTFDGKIPLVMYAEESCTNAGMHLLTYGDTILANPMSDLGSIGTVASPTIIKNFLSKTLLSEVKMVHQGENKVRLNRFADSFKQEDIDWILQLLNKLKMTIIEKTLERRKVQMLAQPEEKQAELKHILESGGSLFGFEAEEYGLIDKAISPEAYFTDLFKDHNVEIKGIEPDWKAKLGLSAYFNTIEASIDESNIGQETNLDFAIKQILEQENVISQMNSTGFQANIPYSIFRQ